MGIFYFFSVLEIAAGILLIRYLIKKRKDREHNGRDDYEKKVNAFILIFAIFMLGSGIFMGGLALSTPKVERSSSPQHSESEMNDLGYYKKNGKWYYQGNGGY